MVKAGGTHAPEVSWCSGLRDGLSTDDSNVFDCAGRGGHGSDQDGLGACQYRHRNRNRGTYDDGVIGPNVVCCLPQQGSAIHREAFVQREEPDNLLW